MAEIRTLDEAKAYLQSWEHVRHNLALDRPRQHGNGFFQLDLDGGYRLHVWDPDAPIAQVVHTPIHDHRFSFESLVLSGEQTHVEYIVLQNVLPTVTKNYNICEVRYGDTEDTKLVNTGIGVFADVVEKVVVPAGEIYDFRMYAFHETPNLGYVVTLLRKTKVDSNHKPRVLCPIGMEPDNDFNRYDLSVDTQWDIIRRAIAVVCEGQEPTTAQYEV